MTQTAFFQENSGAVRFWVEIDGQSVGASIGRDALHYRFRPEARGEDPPGTYHAHAAQLDAAVKKRVAAGLIEPVMLREYDLRAAPDAATG